jgi:serine protease Do
VTAGIVSALGRQNAGSSSYVDFMQISAPINSGNSGGPTFDLNGDVVGVNSAIFSPTGGNVGIGFAIPADTASAVVQQLRANGRVTRGYLGVQVQGMDEEIARGLGLSDTNGALVAGVVDGGPGDQAGLKQGDVVLRIDGHLVEDSRDLTRRIGGYSVGREARLEVWRNGQREQVTVRLGERPSERELALDTNLELPETPPTDALGLGAAVRAATPQEREANQIDSRDPGVFVEMVVAGSDLAAEGVEPGDIILRANGVPIRNAEQLGAMTELSRAQRRPVQLLVGKRNGSLLVIFVDPVPQP